jgi:hypothetical protein
MKKQEANAMEAYTVKTINGADFFAPIILTSKYCYTEIHRTNDLNAASFHETPKNIKVANTLVTISKPKYAVAKTPANVAFTL